MARTKKIMKYRRKVTKVIDGDTVKVSKPVRGSSYIRLAGVNAPEKRQRGYGTAKRKLRSRVGGKKVGVRPVGKSYGRTVGKIRKVRGDRKKRRKR